MTIIEMYVHMCCSGCEIKIKKALEKIKGVDSVEIEMSMQKVTVTGWADQKKVLKTVRRTGRRAELWQFPYNPNYDNYTNRYNHQHQSIDSAGPIGTYTYAYSSQPSSSYNYYKHGYDSHNFSRYNQLPANSSVFGGQTGAVFSDENPHSCSIM